MSPTAAVPDLEAGVTRPKRADALANLERVTRAAAEVFAEKGLDAGVPEIAARAGVGKATVYRSFPTKEHLVAAVVCERLRWLERVAEEACGGDDAWGAFVEVLGVAAEAQARDCALATSMVSECSLPELQAARQASLDAMDRLIVRAQEQGAMRPGVSSADIRVLFAGIGRVLVDRGEHDPGVWRRHAGLIADALRADGTPAQPLAPLPKERP